MVSLVLDKVFRASPPVADTSEHDWLEGRGERLYLIHMIDDAARCRRPARGLMLAS
jgi:hypothetical protein